jgi:hypothetical protein
MAKYVSVDVSVSQLTVGNSIVSSIVVMVSEEFYSCFRSEKTILILCFY